MGYFNLELFVDLFNYYMESEFGVNICGEERSVTYSFSMSGAKMKKHFERVDNLVERVQSNNPNIKMTRLDCFNWNEDDGLCYDVVINYDEKMISFKFPKVILRLPEINILSASLKLKMLEQSKMLKKYSKHVFKIQHASLVEMQITPIFLLLQITFGSLAYDLQF
jgi:hypothetical protein